MYADKNLHEFKTSILVLRHRDNSSRSKICSQVIHYMTCIPYIIRGCGLKCLHCSKFYGYSHSPSHKKGG